MGYKVDVYEMDGGKEGSFSFMHGRSVWLGLVLVETLPYH